MSERVLVTQFRRIGDALVTTPLLDTLRAAHPDWHITVLLDRGCDEPLLGHPSVDAVLAIRREDWTHPWRGPLAWRRVHAVRATIALDVLSTPFSAAVCRVSGARRRIGFDLRARRRFYTDAVPRDTGGSRYAGTARQALLAPLGIAPVERAPSLAPDFADDAVAARLCAPDTRLVLLTTTSRRAPRRWPPERFAQLATRLAADGACVRLLWGPGERADAETVLAHGIAGDVALAPETPSLRALAGVLHRARVLAGNDNGTRHLAIALGVPTVGIFGPNDPSAWTPPVHTTAVPHRTLRGAPCVCASPSQCATPVCIAGVTVEAVLDAVRAACATEARR